MSNLVVLVLVTNTDRPVLRTRAIHIELVFVPVSVRLLVRHQSVLLASRSCRSWDF